MEFEQTINDFKENGDTVSSPIWIFISFYLWLQKKDTCFRMYVISMRIKLKSLGQIELESLLLTTRQIGRKTG